MEPSAETPLGPTLDAQMDLTLRSLAVPKYKRLQLFFEQKIKEGAYRPDDQLPTEKELMRQFNYSYTTVNRALQALVKDGWVRRKRGHGTFVNEATGSLEATPIGQEKVATTLAHFHGGYPSKFHPFYTLLLEGFLAAADRLSEPDRGLGRLRPRRRSRSLRGQ